MASRDIDYATKYLPVPVTIPCLKKDSYVHANQEKLNKTRYLLTLSKLDLFSESVTFLLILAISSSLT